MGLTSDINQLTTLMKEGRLACISSKDIEDRLLHNKSKERMRFNHYMRHGLPSEDWVVVGHIEPTEQDRIIAERLLAAYNKALDDEEVLSKKPKGDLWEEFKNRKQQDFVGMLGKNEPTILAEYLCNMYSKSATYGTIRGTWGEKVNDIKRSIAYIKDKLIALGEAVDAIPCENPEQGTWGENIYLDIDDTVQKIEKIMGISIASLPGDGDLLKMRSKKGLLFQERELFCLYSAWIIHNILNDDPARRSVCEIGAGVARAAYYCYKFGLKDYTMIDLPRMNVLQGFYILKNLPEAKVILYGEKLDKNVSDSIKIYPDWVFDTIRDKRFGLVYSQDSFPEIDEDVVLGYLRQIKKNTAGYFLSINHESRPFMRLKERDKRQNNVSELIRKVGGYKKIYRHLYWLRPGYTEELYRV